VFWVLYLDTCCFNTLVACRSADTSLGALYPSDVMHSSGHVLGRVSGRVSDSCVSVHTYCQEAVRCDGGVRPSIRNPEESLLYRPHITRHPRDIESNI
jgi:hypothetical protein